MGGVVLLAAGAEAVGCGTSAGSICDEVCDCQGCSDADYDDCIDEIEDAEGDAEDEGCEDEFDTYLDCLDEELACRDNDQIDADGCEDEGKELAECMGTPIG